MDWPKPGRIFPVGYDGWHAVAASRAPPSASGRREPSISCPFEGRA